MSRSLETISQTIIGDATIREAVRTSAILTTMCCSFSIGFAGPGSARQEVGSVRWSSAMRRWVIS
jgi:hypothetical protein